MATELSISFHMLGCCCSLPGPCKGTYLLIWASTLEVFRTYKDPAVPEAQLLGIGTPQVGEERPDFVVHSARENSLGEAAGIGGRWDQGKVPMDWPHSSLHL